MGVNINSCSWFCYRAIFNYNPSMCTSRLSVLPAVVFLILCTAAASPATYADIYKFVDNKGLVHLTNKPPHSGYRLFLPSRKGWREPKVDYQNMKKNRQRFALMIAEAARSQGLPESLVHAVISTESAYDPTAVSSSGAVGLMQLMPDTARRYGVANRYDPVDNLSGGTRYLKDLLVRFDNDLQLALASYNAGEKAVLKYGNKIPPFDETEIYVHKVIELYRKYTVEAFNDA